ncbi:hypothetical protein [endosymbiont GvMRE of Glomus versiforme]|uniref:hypothetical protein n=1 Tax=endosymbiont GvMRE of Glomus versiforme TaxID=2039283 RepID=UPI000EC44663|nr:hypothetical protein [endosymbiont GvMRE of Glomus versiforme]RHZ37753.1 hypothetical protein GvMRE_I1g536 [endosymbiont GvMRE of Glomus versiforme]
MNITCPTCRKTLTCYNCPKPQTLNGETKELSGTLQRELGSKADKNGKPFYFGKLDLEDGNEQVIFFFDPDYDLTVKLQAMGEGDQIKVSGFANRTGNFTVKKLLEVEANREAVIF